MEKNDTMLDTHEPLKPVNRKEAAREVRKVTLYSILLGVGLFAVKMFGGIVGKSQAVIADAVHSLSDLITDFAVFIGFKFWSNPPDKNHPYGHGKIEALVTIIIGAFLVAVALGMGLSAIDKIGAGEVASPDWTAFAVAVVSVISKEFFYRYTIVVGRRIKSRALIANAWHHRTDALGSIPVAVAVAVAAFYPELAFLDLIAAIIVSVFILAAAWNIMKPAFEEIIDTGLPESTLEEIAKIADSVEGVIDAHDIRSRKVGAGFQLDLHLDVPHDLSVFEGHEIAENVRIKLEDKYEDLLSVLIHVDPFMPEDDKEKNK